MFSNPSNTPGQFPTFGGTPAQTPGIFGQGSQSNANPPTGFSGTPAQAPGLFGSTPAQSAPTAGMFGSTPAQSGLFGSTPASTGAPSTGLFGSTPSSGGMFGSTPASGGLFGGTPAASTGLFGKPATAGMFGSTPAASTGLFGATQTQAGGLFGATPAPSTGIFGKQTTNGAFGSNQAAGGMFATAAPAGGMFGAAPSGMFGTSSNVMGQVLPGQHNLMPHQLSIEDHITNMVAAWNPSSPSCQFKHYFYNMVHTSQVDFYKPTAPHELMAYERAQQNNPDPTCMVPVLAIGFSDLKKRIDSQDQQTQAHLLKLSEMQTEAESIERKHQLETTPKLREYKRRQAAIAHKLLQLMKYIQILRNKGYSIRAEEEALRSRLETLEKEFTRSSVFKGKFLEIYTQVRSLSDAVQYSEKQDSYSLVDESSLDAIGETLKNQTLGLSHLTNILQSDKKDLDIMIRGYSETLIKKS